tara:strand:+ start:383 stop:1519 length:1137 start_codon:yes stop_codon:yes gene_type:complete
MLNGFMRLNILVIVTGSLMLILSGWTTVTAQVGRDWGIQSRIYNDPVTGVKIRELTKPPAASDNLYYHFSNFTADNRHLIFACNLSGSTQIFRVDVDTGRLFQLTEGDGINSRGACPDPNVARRVYHLRGPEVFAVDIIDFTTTKVGEIPPPRMGGYQQPTLSDDGRWMALMKKRDAANWEIGLLDLKTGKYKTVITQGFQIGHVQHSPTDPIIFYVWETGGYAPQRSWLVNTDGTGNRPFYVRTKPDSWFTPLKEWVTHEAWIRDTGEMTMINDRQGVMVLSKDGKSQMIREGHYWHAAARPDGKYLVLDDFEGRLWLMERATGNIRLLATGLRDKVKIHAHASFDRLGRYVQFHTGNTHETVALIDLESLPPLKWR